MNPLHKLPPDPEGDNDQRAEWAGQCLAVLRSLTEPEPEPVVTEMLTSLAHYCDRNGLLLHQQVSEAAIHYGEETEWKGNQFLP